MTVLTCRWKLRGLVIWIIGVVIIILVTPNAGVGRVVVISIMTGHTLIGNCRMRPKQRIVIIVVREQCRVPVWCRSMTRHTIHRQSERLMVWIGRAIIIGSMACAAFRRRVLIPIAMTIDTCYCEMRPGQREV